MSSLGLFILGAGALVACTGTADICANDSCVATDAASDAPAQDASEAHDATAVSDASTDAPRAIDAPSVDSTACSPPETLNCGGTCVDPTQPAHCGSCSNVCPGPAAGMGTSVCTLGADGGGTCSVSCDGTTTLDCDDTCYDPTDLHHCGGCSNDCTTTVPANAMATCAAGVDGGPSCGFACNATFHACNGACDSNSDEPSDGNDPCIISEMFGIFVSPAGDDGNAGTQLKPVKTIGHAMDLAKAADKQRVYACGTAGSYDENLVVTSTRDGVQAFGALDCTTNTAQWAYDAAKPAIVAPTAAGYALEVSGLATGVSFESFGFEVGNAPVSAPGTSAIAVFVHGSTGVELRSCTVSAGTGVQGQNQMQPAPFATNAPTGTAGTLLGGGTETPNPTCSTSSGGAGGQPTAGGQPGTDGSPGPSNKGTVAGCGSAQGLGGGAGAGGGNGGAGSAASSWAAFSTSGWTASGGTNGDSGAVGQGGGGGASTDNTGGGGAGGAGGCGGAGGGAGTGGGSSIGLLVFDSSVDVETCTVTAAAAGGGGSGALGQNGQTGGTHGNPFGNACGGGKGGNGGNGGMGGGGAGGLSAGIVWTGTAPTVNGLSTPSAVSLSGFTTGTAGAAGQNGDGTTTAKAGSAGAVVQFQ